MQVITAYVFRDLQKLKTSALRLWDVTCNQALLLSHYKGKKLFSPKAIEKIAAYSQGLPRLVNTICDTALLLVHTAVKKQPVSVEMVKEEKLVQPRVEMSAKTDMAGANFQILGNGHETEAEEAPRAQFGDRIVSLEDELPKIYFKRGPTKWAITVFAGIVLLLCIATVSYLPLSKNALSHLAVNREIIAPQGPHNTSDLQVIVEGSKTQPVAPQLSSTNHEPAQPDPDGRESTAERAQGHLENFEVVDDSFVRDKPQSNATIIATLRPGTQVTVESKTEGYFHIHSLSDADIIGYVHEEDAFFQAIK
ncbi:MAG TPA: SH3 domain-containing protein [Candidatus Binatia bacterium]|jgi:hypothetical protein